MKCIYIYKGKTFNSEIELDDFLINQHLLLDKLGDIVFSLNGLQTSTVNTLKNEEDKANKLQAIYRQALNNRIINSTGGSLNFKPPYVGVNKFLSGLTNDAGELLFPEFKKDNYWNERYENWKKNLYNEDEIALFFDGGPTVAISDANQQKLHREKMEEQWEHQAIIGDAMHSILELYFSKIKDTNGNPVLDKNGNYVYYKDKLNSISTYKSKFRNKLRHNHYKCFNSGKPDIKFDDIITDAHFDLALDLCHQIENSIKNKFGDDCIYYPEFRITGKVNKTKDGADTVLGIIDLLVIDKKGLPHVIDYKTSKHNIDEYNSAKKLSFTYQLLTYGRLLAKAGLNINDTNYLIVPIQITDFLKDPVKTFTFSGFTLKNDTFFDITNEALSEKKNNNLNEIIDYDINTEMSSDEILTNVQDLMLYWFKDYSQYKNRTIEEIKEIAKKQGALEPDDKGMLNFIPLGSRTGKPVCSVDTSKSSNPEVEMINKMKKWFDERPIYREKILNNITRQIKEAIKNKSTEGIEFTDRDGQAWFSKIIERYCNGCWEVKDSDAFAPLKALGIITFYNPENRQYNFLKLTSLNVDRQFNFGSGKKTSLGGNFKSDLYFQSNPNSMMMQGTYGNIEIIETMLAINQMKNVFGDENCVGNIMVADPQLGVGLEAASNFELQKTFNELEFVGKKKIKGENNFRNGKIKMASKLQLARTQLNDCMRIGQEKERNGAYNRYSDFASCKSMLDTAITDKETVDKKIKALEEIIKKLEKTDTNKELINYTTDQSTLAKDHVALYNICVLALAELKGINFRQLMNDHDSWLQSINIIKNGLSGNNIDNPGTLPSETLNSLTKLVTQAYQNVRSDMKSPIAKIKLYTEALKKEKQFGWLTENTIGNETSLYQNMYYKKDGEVFFKDPWDSKTDLTTAEREYLKYAIPIINNNRFFGKEKADTIKLTNPNKYFRIPLCEGGFANKSAKDGLLNGFKNRLKSFNPKNAYAEAKAKAEGIFSDDLEKQQRNSDTFDLFKMTNMFDYGEGNMREELLKRGNYETNLETLLLKHLFTYTMKERVDEVFPLIKASLIHLTTHGFNQNKEFKDDLKYADLYITNKILNKSIIDEKYRGANELANKLKFVASALTLGFSPVQGIYQNIQGLWQNILLIVKKTGGKDLFTIKHLSKAGKVVYKDLVHFGDKPTLTSLVNQEYGINDMDMNTYIDHVKSDLNGIFNFGHSAFKLSSRPDYYNRMTIFEAKMIADGAFDAHSINENGELVYDCTKDERFAAFFNNSPNIEEYNKAKNFYIAQARQFEKEHASNPDETPFVFDLNKKTKLPRAYTNLEAESIKSISDTIYGYYSHEKKSLIHSTLLGSLFMQFRTFWSGKKNQYLAPGGVKLEGKWVPYTEKDENGQEVNYYYQKDDKGNLLFNEPPVKSTDDNASDVLFVLWKGDWKEGIVSTMYQLCLQTTQNGIKEGVANIWYNEDENLRNAYRSNIKQLAFDLFFGILVGNIAAALLGNWYEDEKKNSVKTDMADALKLSAINIGIKSLKNSFLDFNFITSIGDPSVNWTPFAFEYFGNQMNNVWDTAFGDLNIWTAICRTNSLSNQFKPVFYTLKERSKLEN